MSSGQNDMGKGGALGERAPCLQPANWEDADNVKEWFLQMMNRLPSPMKGGAEITDRVDHLGSVA